MCRHLKTSEIYEIKKRDIEQFWIKMASKTILIQLTPTWNTHSPIVIIRRSFCGDYSLRLGLSLRVHTEWRLPISGVHPIMMEKSTLASEGGGAHPFSLLPSRIKLLCTLQMRRLTLFPLSPFHPLRSQLHVGGGGWERRGASFLFWPQQLSSIA